MPVAKASLHRTTLSSQQPMAALPIPQSAEQPPLEMCILKMFSTLDKQIWSPAHRFCAQPQAEYTAADVTPATHSAFEHPLPIHIPVGLELQAWR